MHKMSLLGMALWFVGLLHFASARSNGNFFLCEVFAKNWGCKQFQDINQRNRNTKGLCCNKGGKGKFNVPADKCLNRCCDNPAPIMFWVEAPKWDRGLRYKIRSGKGDPSKDPTTFYPGELVDIYVHVLQRDAKFTGLLMNAIAVDHNDTKIGKWEFGQADPNPLYWSTPYCPDSALHTSAEEKPYISHLRWRAPKQIKGRPVGKVHFQTLIKRGGANHGQFYWSELFMSSAPERASGKFSWVQSGKGQSCSEACQGRKLRCFPDPMQDIRSSAAFAPIARKTMCTLPLLAGCAASVEGKDRCYYQDSTCTTRPTCRTTLPDAGMMCACGLASDYEKLFPGKSLESVVSGSPPVHTLASTLVTALSLGLVGRQSPLMSAVAAMAMVVGRVRGHNWAHSEFRSRLKAVGNKPCPPRVGDRFGVQVGPQQEFVAAWATGHGHNATVLVVRGEDLHRVGRDTIKIARRYMDAAPANAHLKDEKWRRLHGSKYKVPHTKDAAKYMTPLPRDSPLHEMSRIVEVTAAAQGGGSWNSEDKKDKGPNLFSIAPERTKDDIYTSYKHPDMEWITHAGFFKLSEVNFGEFDQVRFAMPAWAKPGHYVLIWDWQGYGDCLDIELRSKEVKHKYGQGSGKWTWNRVEHCQLAKPFKTVAGVCRRAAPTVEQCFKDVDEVQNTGSKGQFYDIWRIGINVMPVLAPSTVNPLFTRKDGASIDVPWDAQWNKFFPGQTGDKGHPDASGELPGTARGMGVTNVERCLVGGPLDLAGTVTRTDSDWQRQWSKRKTSSLGACRAKDGVLFSGERSLREAVQRCTTPSCVGVVAEADGTYSGCKALAPSSPAIKTTLHKKTAGYSPGKTDMERIRAANYEHLVTVSFQPASAQVQLPADTVADTGAMFGSKPNNKWKYGWTGCAHKRFTALRTKQWGTKDASKYQKDTVENTFAWYLSALCRNPDYKSPPSKVKAEGVSGGTTVRAAGGITPVEGKPFTPEVKHDGKYFPICGHYFWDYPFKGALEVCRALGFTVTVASVQRVGSNYDRDSMPVGKCNAGETLDACTAGGNGFGKFDLMGGFCKAKRGPAITVVCGTQGSADPCVVTATEAELAKHPAKTKDFALTPPPQCKRNTWELEVDNGWYKIVSTVGPLDEQGPKEYTTVAGARPKPHFSNYNQRGWTHRGCAIEGVAFDSRGTRTRNRNKNTYTNYVEVVDGRLTFEDYGGYFACCYTIVCDNINAIKVMKQVGNPVRQAPTWFPQYTDPHIQRAFPAPRKISIVSMLAPQDECRHAWLLHGGQPHCLTKQIPEDVMIEDGQVARGYFESGPVVGVSNTPCSDGGCLKDAQICGRVKKSRFPANHWPQRRSYVEADPYRTRAVAGMANRYWVDCKGKEGKYVFVMLPGKRRILSVTEVKINQISATAGDPKEFEGKFVCYPVEARTAAEHTPEYITSDDPGDPVFYSTCFMRERHVEYLPPEGGDVTPPLVHYEFNEQCLPCDLYNKNKAPAFAVPNTWTFSSVCKNCDARSKCADTCLSE